MKLLQKKLVSSQKFQKGKEAGKRGEIRIRIMNVPEAADEEQGHRKNKKKALRDSYRSQVESVTCWKNLNPRGCSYSPTNHRLEMTYLSLLLPISGKNGESHLTSAYVCQPFNTDHPTKPSLSPSQACVVDMLALSYIQQGSDGVLGFLVCLRLFHY